MRSLSKDSKKSSFLQTESHHAPRLWDFVQELQSRGIYTFTKKGALRQLKSTSKPFDAAARRLQSKGLLAIPRRGFYVIVPTEYRTAKAPPPSWVIDALMTFHQQPYYVGLLSAAEIHGAAHHRPQAFQVLTNAPLRVAPVGRGKIDFYVKKHIEDTPVIQVKTHTGYMRVSSPEATAFDLVRYVDIVGHLDNVATVFAELAEKMDSTRLLFAAQAAVELSVIQRAGYILELVGANLLTASLATWLEKQKPRSTPLRPDCLNQQGTLNDRWHVIVNDVIESEI